MPLTPRTATFTLVSFEGPDPYAQAGGLGVRVGNLAQTLAGRGFDTELFFVGDPEAPGEEQLVEGRLTYHRWCQWISAYHPHGVYDGEEGKLREWSATLPEHLLEHVIRPSLASGRLPVILAEEWHTVDTVLRLYDLLRAAGLDRQCLIFWNANNTMSFHRVDWKRLQRAAQITTVSRYMKHLMWPLGINPLVIHNGVPEHLLEPLPAGRTRALRKAMAPEENALMLFKVGRFDPAKRWRMAVEAAALLKDRGCPIAFPIVGGMEAHGHEVLHLAHERGLSIAEVNGSPATWPELVELLQAAPRADVYNLRFFMTQEMLRAFYAAADAVLANSGHEPFGLVGLEAMAAGGVAFTGPSGEEYVLDGRNAIMLDTDRPEEIASHLIRLQHEPQRAETIRTFARSYAEDFTWDRVVEVLLDKLAFAAEDRHLVAYDAATKMHGLSPTVEDVVIYTVVHQPHRPRLPAAPLTRDLSMEALDHALFDVEMNEHYFRKVARTCYSPALDRFEHLVDEGLSLAIGFSLSFIQQAQAWDEDLLARFRRLVQHDNVELVAVEPSHSFMLLWDIQAFVRRMKHAADELERIFGKRPQVADTTELMMSDTIYHALEQAGFRAAFMDGRPWVMQWREPTHLYHHGPGEMKLLTRHYDLSDDVGYRFSNKGWDGWPLTADQYADWIASAPGKVAVIGWDFETFGEHHPPESGIFDFLAHLPNEGKRHGLSFLTPSEAVERHGDSSHALPLPAFASTWAGSGGLEFFLGNEAQQSVFQLMMQAHQKALLTGKPALVERAARLAQSDNLHLIQWYGRQGAEAEVSAYFTPDEWWHLGPDGIIWELQQVYKHFIAWLDGELPRAKVTPRADHAAREVKEVGGNLMTSVLPEHLRERMLEVQDV